MIAEEVTSPSAPEPIRNPGRRAIAAACRGILLPSNGVDIAADKAEVPWSRTWRRDEMWRYFDSKRTTWRPDLREKKS